MKKCYNGLFCKVCLQVLYLPEKDRRPFGVETLQKYGEVLCTRRLLRLFNGYLLIRIIYPHNLPRDWLSED